MPLATAMAGPPAVIGLPLTCVTVRVSPSRSLSLTSTGTETLPSSLAVKLSAAAEGRLSSLSIEPVPVIPSTVKGSVSSSSTTPSATVGMLTVKLDTPPGMVIVPLPLFTTPLEKVAAP